MSKKKGKVQVIPDWMKVVSNQAFIGTKEICEIFGGGSSNIIRNIEAGIIPAPNKRSEKLTPGRPKNLWRMGDVREFVRRKASE